MFINLILKIFFLFSNIFIQYSLQLTQSFTTRTQADLNSAISTLNGISNKQDYTKITFSNSYSKNQDLTNLSGLSVLSQFHNLEILDFTLPYSMVNSLDAFEFILQNKANLKEFMLQFHDSPFDNQLAFSGLAKGLKNTLALTKLRLYFEKYGDSEPVTNVNFEEVYKSICSLTNLTYLTLWTRNQILPSINEMKNLGNLVNLTYLYVNLGRNDLVDISSLATAFKGQTKIGKKFHLKLDNNNIQDISPLKFAFSDLISVTEFYLELQGNLIQSYSIARCFENFNELEDLHLYIYQNPQMDISQIGEAFIFPTNKNINLHFRIGNVLQDSYYSDVFKHMTGKVGTVKLQILFSHGMNNVNLFEFANQAFFLDMYLFRNTDLNIDFLKNTFVSQVGGSNIRQFFLEFDENSYTDVTAITEMLKPMAKLNMLKITYEQSDNIVNYPTLYENPTVQSFTITFQQTLIHQNFFINSKNAFHTLSTLWWFKLYISSDKSPLIGFEDLYNSFDHTLQGFEIQFYKIIKSDLTFLENTKYKQILAKKISLILQYSDNFNSLNGIKQFFNSTFDKNTANNIVMKSENNKNLSDPSDMQNILGLYPNVEQTDVYITGSPKFTNLKLLIGVFENAAQILRLKFNFFRNNGVTEQWDLQYVLDPLTYYQKVKMTSVMHDALSPYTTSSSQRWGNQINTYGTYLTYGVNNYCFSNFTQAAYHHQTIIQGSKKIAECLDCKYQECYTCLNTNECARCRYSVPARILPSCHCPDGYYSGPDYSCPQCLFGCVTCTDGTSCDSCKVSTNPSRSLPDCNCPLGYYDDGVDPQCLSCSSNCDVCTDGSTCTQCKTGYEVGPSGNCVIGCNSPCASCTTDKDHCLSCITNTYLQSNKCLTCEVAKGTNCLACIDGIQCTSCKPGTVLISGSCEPCTSPCSECTTDQTTCTDCIANNYLKNNECKTCEQHKGVNCLVCSDADTCTSCKSGTVLINKSCEICTSPCSSCQTNQTTCTNCIANHHLKNNECKTCEQHKGVNCLSCSDADTCTQCKPGTVLINKSCEPCTSPCSLCQTDQTTCTDCIANNYLKNNQCKTCEQHKGVNCLACSDADTCTSCKVGTVLMNKSCELCTSPCSECSTNQTTCTNCIVNHHLKNNQCKICSDWKPNCTTCSDANTCTQCNSGYVLISGSCQKCTSPCQECENSQSECTSCIQNFHLKDKQCKICSDWKSQNCLSCSNATTCTSCKPGTVLISQSCEICSSPCSKCQNNQTTCTECIQNHFLKSNQCKTCQDWQGDKCQQCSDANTCTNCIQDYFLKDNLCQTCQQLKGQNCLQCQDNQTCTQCKKGFILISGSCEQCISPCSECEISKTNCTNCIEKKVLVQGQCLDIVCLPECKTCVNQQECELLNKCDKQCNECLKEKDNCVQCNGLNRNEAPSCSCKQGYYEQSGQQNCQICDSQCKSCENHYECTECFDDSLDPKQKCQKKGQITIQRGYFVMFGEECVIGCDQCTENSPAECKSCKQGINRQNNPPACSCQENFHDYRGTTKDCHQCKYPCQQCLDEISCVTCIEGLFRELNVFNNQCECIRGYKENLEKKCQKCYEYQDDCVFECPQSTVQDEVNSICIDMEYEFLDSIPLIVSICLCIITVAIMSYICISQYFRYEQLNQKKQEIPNEIQKKNLDNSQIQDYEDGNGVIDIDSVDQSVHLD